MTPHNFIKEWNNSSKSYADLRFKGLDPYEELVNFPSCLKLLGKIKGRNILDAGSGTGEFSYILNRKGAKVIGIDGAEKLVEISTNSFPKIDFRTADLNKGLPFKDKSFDIIFCKYVLMFIEKPEQLIKEFNRILKTDGILLVSQPHPTYWLHYWLSGYWGLEKREGFSDLEGYFKNKEFSFSIKGNKDLNFSFIHRPLKYYSMLFKKAGFIIDEIDEPEPGKMFLNKDPKSITKFVPKAINFKLLKINN